MKFMIEMALLAQSLRAVCTQKHQIGFQIEFSAADEKLEAVAGRTHLHENDQEFVRLNNLVSANKSGNILMLG